MKKAGLVFFVVTNRVLLSHKIKQNLGTVLDAKTQQPLAYVVVSIQNTNVMQLTARWKIQFDDLIRGDQLVLFTVRATDALFR
jgi:hypothetical protein